MESNCEGDIPGFTNLSSLSTTANVFLLRCHSHVIVVHVCADASLNAATITVGVEPPAGAPAMPTGPPGASTSAPFAASAWPCIGARQMFVRIARAHAPRYDHLIKSITAPKLDIFTPCLLELDKFPVGVHRDTPLRRCVLVVKTTGICGCSRSLCLWPSETRIDSNRICWSKPTICTVVYVLKCVCVCMVSRRACLIHQSASFMSRQVEDKLLPIEQKPTASIISKSVCPSFAWWLACAPRLLLSEEPHVSSTEID